ncbi:S-adenosylmethionine:tRNA ribosyltransferase-isomerase [Halalkalibacter alkalisediminis]|uniref:S-adenosylmethionine:tRNA ribosyltransferase-isomerase n=1 Tax=Halalkalibacter alkalisediminis TaxID=935616 RepID=A0ABV6NMT0_9BACI|nr:S-adenosylmethionine:tRNA ribosyltransferase-isomerase [Halalkalibacter alkalisediminis]
MNHLAYPFQIPSTLHADTPAEYYLNKREAVRLLVQDRLSGECFHQSFVNLDRYLQKGDVLILNNSRTIPAVLYTVNQVEVRLARKVTSNTWEALIIGTQPNIGDTLSFPNHVKGLVMRKNLETPLVSIQFSVSGDDFYEFLYQFGSPIRYEYIKKEWPIDAYQTVFSSVPGSIEMPSAGRALSWKMLAKLQKEGIEIGFIQLHTGLSYYGDNRWPEPSKHPERFSVSSEVVNLIEAAKARGSKVIAVGTTVVRALESAVDANAVLHPVTGETTLHIKEDSLLHVVDGLLTGFHETEASHLDMLSAFIHSSHLLSTYQEAIHQGYLWHEFGDMNLLLRLDQ